MKTASRVTAHFEGATESVSAYVQVYVYTYECRRVSAYKVISLENPSKIKTKADSK